MPQKRCVSVYGRGRLLILSTSSKTVGRHGLWIEVGPIRVLLKQASPDEVGRALLDALEDSRDEVPLPHDPESVQVPLLKAAGVSSWGSFMRGASHIYFERDSSGIRMIPSEVDGGNFVPVVGLTRHLAESAVDLGNAIKETVSTLTEK